ncbi:glycosyltransferase family 2 protein, partial [Candidatus Parcubacteria bacterium]
ISVHGYNFPIPELSEPFFLKGADCWGWGTWKRGWALFERDGSKLLRELKRKKLLSRFDFFGGYLFSAMLKDQIKGKNQSWAVRWYASALLQGKLTLYPGKTLVRHIGADSGTHCKTGGMEVFESDVGVHPVDLSDVRVEEDARAVDAIAAFLRGVGPPLHKRMMRKIARMVGWSG